MLIVKFLFVTKSCYATALFGYSMFTLTSAKCRDYWLGIFFCILNVSRFLLPTNAVEAPHV